MRKWIAILLVSVFAVIGSGALQYLHESEHLHEAAIAQKHSPAHHGNDPDEEHCAVCTVLHMPTVSQGYVPILLTLGILIAIAVQFVLQSHAYSFRSLIDSRGPPFAG